MNASTYAVELTTSRKFNRSTIARTRNAIDHIVAGYHRTQRVADGEGGYIRRPIRSGEYTPFPIGN